MNKKNYQLKSSIIDYREKIDKKINFYHDVLKTENIVNKNSKRNYNLKKVITKIFDLSHQRVLAKLDNLCINLGYKSRTELPKSSIYPIIYELSEKTELIVRLSKIPTLPKKNPSKTEELNKGYINNLINGLKLEAISLRNKLEIFNNEENLFDYSGGYVYYAA